MSEPAEDTQRRGRRSGGRAGNRQRAGTAAIHQAPWIIPENRDRPVEPLDEEGVERIHNGAMRILWEAKPSAGASSSGTLRITIHSAISGRPLLVAVDHKGPGKGTAFVGEDPRVFFAEIDSHDLDWSFTVQERIN